MQRLFDFPPEMASTFFRVMDADDSGVVETHEALAAICMMCVDASGDTGWKNSELAAQLMFEAWDTNRNGLLSMDELAALVALGQKMGSALHTSQA